MEEIFELLSSWTAMIPSILTTILPMVGMWFVFEKAGESGWTSLIPFYNMYVLMKLVDRKKMYPLWLIGNILLWVALYAIGFAFIMLLAAGFAGGMAPDWINDLFHSVPIFVFALLAGIIMNAIATIMTYSGICECMGQSKIMIAGLWFFPYIFWPILGLMKKYVWIGRPQTIRQMASEMQTPPSDGPMVM